MIRLLSMAFAPNTQRAYLTGWNQFCRFWQCPSIPEKAASVHDVRRFIAWLSLRQLAPATIALYTAGVGYIHKMHGWPDPTKDFIVSKLLEGCRRDRPVSDTRLPISVATLGQLCYALQYVCASQFECALFKAAVLCAFFGFMRIGEFSANSCHVVQDSVLKISDVKFHKSGSKMSVLITFRHSKANQAGTPQTVCLVQSEDVTLCPVFALHNFIEIRPRVEGPLFCHFDTSPLTKYQFNAVLKKALAFSGLGESHITSHSFRIGAATVAFERGVPQNVIQQMGRWRSDAVFSYIRPIQDSILPGI